MVVILRRLRRLPAARSRFFREAYLVIDRYLTIAQTIVIVLPPPYTRHLNPLPQTGNASAAFSVDVDMNVIAGEVPFEYIIEDLEQASSEPAGFDMRVSSKNSAGYGRPSTVLNVKVCR